MANLHPDFFDGETPIVDDPDQPKIYVVRAKIQKAVYIRAFDSESAIEESEESVWYGSDIEAINADEISIDRIPVWKRDAIIDAEDFDHGSA